MLVRRDTEPFVIRVKGGHNVDCNTGQTRSPASRVSERSSTRRNVKSTRLNSGIYDAVNATSASATGLQYGSPDQSSRILLPSYNNLPRRSCVTSGASRPTLLQLPQYIFSGMTIQLVPTINQHRNDLAERYYCPHLSPHGFFRSRFKAVIAGVCAVLS